jgi:hypothetical protein
VGHGEGERVEVGGRHERARAVQLDDEGLGAGRRRVGDRALEEVDDDRVEVPGDLHHVDEGGPSRLLRTCDLRRGAEDATMPKSAHTMGNLRNGPLQRGTCGSGLVPARIPSGHRGREGGRRQNHRQRSARPHGRP